MFWETVNGHEIVLVDFWAGLVRPLPEVRAGVSSRHPRTHPDIVFAKVDTEAEQEISAAGGHQVHPHALRLPGRHPALLPGRGALPEPALAELIRRVAGPWTWTTCAVRSRRPKPTA